MVADLFNDGIRTHAIHLIGERFTTEPNLYLRHPELRPAGKHVFRMSHRKLNLLHLKIYSLKAKLIAGVHILCKKVFFQKINKYFPAKL